MGKVKCVECNLLASRMVEGKFYCDKCVVKAPSYKYGYKKHAGKPLKKVLKKSWWQRVKDFLRG